MREIASLVSLILFSAVIRAEENAMSGMGDMSSMSPSMPNMSPSMPNMSPSMPNMSPSMPNMSPSMPSMSPNMPNMPPSVPSGAPTDIPTTPATGKSGDDGPTMRSEMDPIGMMGGKFTGGDSEGAKILGNYTHELGSNSLLHGVINTGALRYLQPINVGRDLKFDDLSHNDGYLCTRDCCIDSKPRLCYFQFTVEQYAAMGPACRNCTNGNLEDCMQQQCVTLDGIERMVFTFNRMIPGPVINVCAGDRIVVDILNMMSSAALTIHWHGVLQQKSPWMDGVPFVSQCPIDPNAFFRYDFTVDELGTYFYHAHTGNIQKDGLYGALVVKHCRDPCKYEYDFDLPSHTMIVGDLTHFPSDVYFPGYFLNASMIPGEPHGYVINGRGSYQDSVTQTNIPPKTFHVKSGFRYLFRIVGATFGNCLFKLGIEEHSMTITALDGYPTKPVIVNTLVMGSGTRTDVVIDARQKPSSACSYHIVVKGVDSCEDTTSAQIAYLVYDDCDPIPTSKPPLQSVYDKPPYLDNVVGGCEAPDIFCSHELRAIDAASPRITSGDPDYRFFLKMDAVLLDYNEIFENKMNPYQFFYLPVGGRPPIPGLGIFADMINKVSGMMPPFPILYQTDLIPDDMICHGQCNDSNATFCFCINIFEAKLNTVVEMVLVDEMSGPNGPILNHPMHIHGYNWAVLKQGSMDERMKNPDTFWVDRENANDPAIRDVLIIPSGGFAVVRFIANNPGYWMIHCHFQAHMMGGMFLFIKVGERDQFLPPPKDFPRCSPYLPEISNIDDYDRCDCSCGRPQSECQKCTKVLQCQAPCDNSCGCNGPQNDCFDCTKP